jgi:chromosome segregation ATPase
MTELDELRDTVARHTTEIAVLAARQQSLNERTSGLAASTEELRREVKLLSDFVRDSMQRFTTLLSENVVAQERARVRMLFAALVAFAGGAMAMVPWVVDHLLS